MIQTYIEITPRECRRQLIKSIAVLMALIFAQLVAHGAPASARPQGPTAATHSEYLTSLAALVLLKRDASASRFGLTLGLTKPLPKGATLVVEFENLAEPKAPFKVHATFDSANRALVQSPEFDGIYNKRSYLARAKIVGFDEQEISIHEQWIWFEIPPAIKSDYATKILE